MTRDRRNLARSDFYKIADYLKRNNETNIGIIGGEPTLHPHIVEMIEYALDKGFKVQLFTNGLMQDTIARRLADLDQKQFRLLININDKSFYTQSRLADIEKSLNLFHHNAVLGYTIFSPDFDLSFHAELIKRHDLGRGLRLGIASPVVGHPSKSVETTENMQQVAARVIENIHGLEEENILLNFDCGFTMCMFTTEQLGIITQKTKGFMSMCNPVIDIDIDLNIHHCFPLTNVLAVPMESIPDLNELRYQYEKRFQAIKIFGNQGKCLDCKYLKRHQCGGWCLGRILNSDTSLLEKIKTVGAKEFFASNKQDTNG